MAAKRLKKEPEACIVFEDAVSGVKAADGAGMFTIGVGVAYQASLLQEVGAKEVIANFERVSLKAEQEGLQLQISPSMSLYVVGE
jgi:beta-phosphoglucomutase-like phosphatase (HAD superfamily)